MREPLPARVAAGLCGGEWTSKGQETPSPCDRAMRQRLMWNRRLEVGIFLSSIALAIGTPVGAQTIANGDTIKLNGATYRLWGIDAPESRQICADGWPAGHLAATRLRALVKGRTVHCEERDRDPYGNIVAVCKVAGEDLGAVLVREGLAWAFVRHSEDYESQEALAKKEGLGIHAHACTPAWEWRAQHRREAHHAEHDRFSNLEKSAERLSQNAVSVVAPRLDPSFGDGRGVFGFFAAGDHHRGTAF